jgi:hypothetical protein
VAATESRHNPIIRQFVPLNTSGRGDLCRICTHEKGITLAYVASRSQTVGPRKGTERYEWDIGRGRAAPKGPELTHLGGHCRGEEQRRDAERFGAVVKDRAQFALL